MACPYVGLLIDSHAWRGILRANGEKRGGRVEHHCWGGYVKSDLLSRESKQRVTWNFSPDVWTPIIGQPNKDGILALKEKLLGVLETISYDRVGGFHRVAR